MYKELNNNNGAQTSTLDVNALEMEEPTNRQKQYDRSYRTRSLGWICIFGLIFMIAVIIGLSVLNTYNRFKQNQDVQDDPYVNTILRTDYFGKPRTIQGLYNGVVAADVSICSDVGVKVMKDEGGNAVDALVAVILCQGVLHPEASGVGGGGFIVISFNGTHDVIDAREYAPQAANSSLFQNNGYSTFRGGTAIAVPLELLGLETAHKKYGILPWKLLFSYAIKFAEEGFEITPFLRHTFLKMEQDGLYKDMKTFGLVSTFYVKNKNGEFRIPEVGEVCCQRPVFANTLRAVAENGPAALYQGQLGRDLVDDINEAGGIFEYDDISTAKVVVKAPLISEVGDLTFVQAPPPSSSCLIPLAIRIYRHLKHTFENTVIDYHYLIESMKHIFAIRMHLGDEQFVDLDSLLNNIRSNQFVANITKYISPSTTFPSGNIYGGGYPPVLSETVEDKGTSHVSIMDKDGMAVAMTSTINTRFGSYVVSRKTGILLNNEMDDFSVAGEPNAYGLAPSEPNFIYPGKKPLSSSSPTIIERGGRPIMITGASGGPRIITGVIQIILRVLFGEDDLGDAEAAAQVHHQLYPQLTRIENFSMGAINYGLDPTIVEGLTQKNHNISLHHSTGSSRQTIIVNADGSKSAASDPRKDGAPAGY